MARACCRPAGTRPTSTTATSSSRMRLGGGMHASARIAILGAGPAGVSLAWHLHQLQLGAVELFDAGDEVGGQSFTRLVDGVPVELGTCYLTEGYRIVRDIGAEVADDAVPLGQVA